jgi:hypothetical protein
MPWYDGKGAELSYRDLRRPVIETGGLYIIASAVRSGLDVCTARWMVDHASRSSILEWSRPERPRPMRLIARGRAVVSY